MIYDIIGDVHGQAGKLRNLLDHIGYNLIDGLYRRPGHTLIFVGDLIDRVPHQKQVLDIVRPMVSEGLAYAVMGNHEYNAICYHTRRSNSNISEWLRPHTDTKTKQHIAFLNEYPLKSKEAANAINWFMSLPLYLDFKNFRIIHACWDQKAITRAHQLELLTEDNKLNQEQLEASATNGTEPFDIIERLLKGPEVSGADPFLDKDGIERREVRTRWWGDINAESTYQDLAFWYDTDQVCIPAKTINNYDLLPTYDTTQPPVFFGHYWLNHGLIRLQQLNVACLDYSAGKEGPLVAYRFDSSKPPAPLCESNLYHSY